MSVAVLYAKEGSVYFGLGVDVWDEARDARLYAGPFPVVAHPPCRAWGKLRTFAKPREHERDLALHALRCVRRFGGVLEHPASSELWRVARLPRPGEFPDEYGGYTLEVDQCDWGHRAQKRTWLYVVGVPWGRLPPMPCKGRATTTVERMWRGEREATPPRLASWLIQLASRANTSLVQICI